MRVTGGTAKGQLLKVPGRSDIRPTTDRTREAIFSILGSLVGEWDRCLDLYAGTGALGIEALSRGASWVDFVEKDRRTCDIIKGNLERLSFKQNTHVYCFDVKRVLSILREAYDIVFIDPPYADRSIEDTISQIADSDIIKKNTVLVVSHSSRIPLKSEYDGLKLIKEKRYGDTSISIYNLEG